MGQQKTTMAVVSQNGREKIKLKYNFIPCICWTFGILFSFAPMLIEYANNFINEDHPNLYLTLFGDIEVLFICVSFSIAILFYIMEKRLINPNEKSVYIVLYVAFAILLFIIVICIGVYVKQSTDETVILTDIISAIENDMPKEQLLSDLTMWMEEAAVRSQNIGKVGVVVFSTSCIVGLISFLDIKRS